MAIEIVGISGKAGSGKDYVGRTVLRPRGFKQWAMAWPLKAQCMGLGYTFEAVFKDKPENVRRDLQVLGTEQGWMKHGRQYWTKQAEAYVRLLNEEWGITKFYFTDIRFTHETEWVRNMGGKLIRLEHDSRPYPLQGTPAAEHSSETALDKWNDWDAVIYNGLGVEPEHIERQLVAARVLPPTWSGVREQLTLFDEAGDVTFDGELGVPRG